MQTFEAGRVLAVLWVSAQSVTMRSKWYSSPHRATRSGRTNCCKRRAMPRSKQLLLYGITQTCDPVPQGILYALAPAPADTPAVFNIAQHITEALPTHNGGSQRRQFVGPDCVLFELRVVVRRAKTILVEQAMINLGDFRRRRINPVAATVSFIADLLMKFVPRRGQRPG